MLSFAFELSHASLKNPWQAGICFLNIFSFAFIFFIVLSLSYLISSDISRYDFVSFSLIAIYSVFFICNWRNARHLLIHSVVHFLGLFFEIYKVSQLSWVYPDQGWLMLWGVPFYSGFMYTALVDFVCQAMRYSKFQLVKAVPWKAVGLLCFLIYLNFFLVHLIKVDFRYLLVAASVVILLSLPVRVTIKKTTIELNLLPLMLVFACMVWVAENLATMSGAWLYLTQLNGWVPVSPHKLVSWYLLGQFFVFIVIYCNNINPWLVFSNPTQSNISQQPLKEK